MNTDLSGRVCGCMGCKRDAARKIDHPEHGERVVCATHAEDLEVNRSA